MKRFILPMLLIAVCLSTISEARSRNRRKVPLMQPRLQELAYGPVPVYYTNSTAVRSASPRDGGWGAEFGTLGRRNSTDGSVLGMDLMIGGRIIADFPLWKRVSIKPSLGFFTRSEGEAAVNVSEHTIEVGGSLIYDLTPYRKGRIGIGLANRIDLQTVTITALSSSGSSPLVLNYRLGPTLNFEIPVGGQTRLTINAEGTVSPNDKWRSFAGLTLGFISRVW